MSEHMPNLPVCPHCGTPLPELATKTERLEEECSRLHGQNRYLKGELTKIQGGGSDAKAIEQLHDEWLAPRACRPGRKPALTDDRKKAYRKLLAEFGKEDAINILKQSARTPYLIFGNDWATSGEVRDRRDDITDLVAKAKRAERLLAMYDGDAAIPAPVEAQGVPRAHLLHGPMQGWTPLARATTALKREGGWDTCTPEFEEQTLLNDIRITRWRSWCPRHPHAFVGLRLWEDKQQRVRAECDGACSEVEIVRAIFALEDAQVRRVEALLAFDRVASPETLDKVVTALDIRKEDSRYSIARKLGIHDNDALGLTADPREVKWAA
jgi:hypothetical protein